MIKNELDLTMQDGQIIHLYLWEPDEGVKPKGIVQIAHGAAEYGKRYEDFGLYLAANGFIVCANDHRGHGLSAKDKGDLGFFSDEDGWNKLTDDLYTITQYLKNKYELEVSLFGHSMGSFLARTYAIAYGREIKGLILSGTAYHPKPLLLFGKFVAQRDIKRGKERGRNPLLNQLVFKDLNNGFKGGNTDYDWISRDTAIVDKYSKDKYCGFDFTSSALKDLFDGLLFITDRKNIKKTQKELPVLILAGKDDPVGAKGKMVKKCYRKYAHAGIKNLTIKLYEGMRHEITNEIGKEEVYQDVLNWLGNIFPKS